MRLFLLLFALTIAHIAVAQSQPTAIEEFVDLQKQAHAAKEAGDQRARIAVILKLQKFLNNEALAIETTAQAYAEAGDTPRAIAALRQFAGMGQVDEKLLNRKFEGKLAAFAALANLPEYQSILKSFAANQTPVMLATTLFALPDPGLLAEDIDYDARSPSFLITSVLEKKIVRVTLDGKSTEFARSPSDWPLLAIKIDSARNLVWATEVALDGFTVAPKGDWGRSALLCLDLHSGKLLRRIEGPAHTSLGDMVLTGAGEPIVSDGEGGGVYLLKGDALERVDGGDFISPQTPALLPGGHAILVPDYARGIGMLDLATKHVIWLNNIRDGVTPATHTLGGIDGLYFDQDSLIATQNGTSPERVVRFKLDAARSAVVGEQIIERSTTTLGDPTHGVIVGDFFYYIANSGWSELDDHGNVKTGSRLTPALIMRVRR